MRISSRAGAAWFVAEAGEPGTAGIEIVEPARPISGEGAVITEAIMEKTLGEWRLAHPSASLFLETIAIVTSDAGFFAIKISPFSYM
jgi:hypothetical protein